MMMDVRQYRERALMMGFYYFYLEFVNNFIILFQFESTSSMYQQNQASHDCNSMGEEMYFASQANYNKHASRHIPPHQLVPKTNPNNLPKVQQLKVNIIDDTTEESQIAIRSILPNQVPNFGDPIKNIRNIQTVVGNTSSRPFKLGGNNIKVKNEQHDLNSNIVGTVIERQDREQLNIEKEIELRPIKANIVKKQVHKIQNNHMAAREIVDMGRHEKKVPNAPMKEQRVGGANPFNQSNSTDDDHVYEIKKAEDVPFFSFLPTFIGSPAEKTSTSVNFNRKTVPANVFTAIQTKSSPQKKQNTRDLSSVDGNEYGKVGNYNPYNQEEENGNKNYQGQNRDRERDVGRQIPLHPHECPSCHGFYCAHCKSDIPAKYRPFWDQNERPELIEYYKKRQEQARKNQCPDCNHK